MKPRFVLSSVLAVGLLAFAVPGFAQQTRSPDVMPARNSGTSTGDQGGSGGNGGNGPANDAPAPSAEKKGPIVPVGGYAYSDKPAAGSAPRTKYRAAGATVAMPGFEQGTDGASRFFVQLSQTVTVEERKTPGTITYVMKGASPRVWNNTNALVTVHFSTPVSRARLVPQGNDLLFILDLRASSTPTYKIVDTADKGAQLTIEFPKGDWLNAAAPVQSDTTTATTDAPAAAKVRTTGRKKKK